MKNISLTVVVLFLVLGILILPTYASAYDEYEENGFFYAVKDKQAVVRGTEIKEDELYIPDTLGGFPVTEIGEYAFSQSKFTSIHLPDTITKIGYAAFWKSKKIKSVRLPGSLQRLNSQAFRGCTGLTEVLFNNKLNTIDYQVFYSCISLKKVVLPNSVENIGQEAFAKCYKLSGVTLGDNLRTIGAGAFSRNYKLKEICIPAKVKNVDDRVFNACETLSSVQFDNEKTKLGKAVFYGCTSLERAVLPDQISDIPEFTFAGCDKLSKAVVPENVSIIKRRAFYRCKALKKVTLNDKVYAVGDEAFAFSGLSKLKLNKKMKFIGNGAFQETSLSELKLPSKIAFIGSRVFADCRKLNKIKIPASVKGINPGAFNNCVSLRAINVSAGNKNYSSAEGVLYDKYKTKLIQYPLHKTSKTFRTPGHLNRIRSNAFSGNPYLQEVTVSADSIGDYAFYKMKKLKSVTLLNGMKKIGNYAFKNNKSLRRVTLPDSIVSIGEMGFAETSVKSIHIPSKLVLLGSHAFLQCNKLVEFTGGWGAKYTVKDGVLYNRSMTELIKYPAKRPAKTFVAPYSVKTVKENAFDHVTFLSKLEFEKNLFTMEYRAVCNAKNLKSIIFHSNKLSYRISYSVADCNKLAVIVGPKNYALQKLANKANATLITL